MNFVPISSIQSSNSVSRRPPAHTYRSRSQEEEGARSKQPSKIRSASLGNSEIQFRMLGLQLKQNTESTNLNVYLKKESKKTTQIKDSTLLSNDDVLDDSFFKKKFELEARVKKKGGLGALEKDFFNKTECIKASTWKHGGLDISLGLLVTLDELTQDSQDNELILLCAKQLFTLGSLAYENKDSGFCSKCLEKLKQYAFRTSLKEIALICDQLKQLKVSSNLLPNNDSTTTIEEERYRRLFLNKPKKF